MANFDFITLKFFLEENLNFLQGARLQKIQQPTRQDLIFHMRNLGETKKFYVNISPKFFHICFINEKTEKKRFIQIPQNPPMFCMLLRKYLENSKIAKVCQPKNERILEFYFETYNETGEQIYLCLVIELMGKHSNVILYNYDTNIIIGCMHNIGAEKSSVREIIGGLPYTYPPQKNNKIITGLSSILNRDISINENIDNYFAPRQEKEKIKLIKSKLSNNVNSKLKKVNTSLEKIIKQSITVEKANLYRKKADLIMGVNVFEKKDFVNEIEVIDWETNLPLKIELDETKTLKENANQFYKLYNKAKTANFKSQEIIENLQKEKKYLEQVLYSIEAANDIEDLIEINEEISDIKIKNIKHAKKDSLHNFLTVKIDNFNIYIGKNNKQNDYIVSKLSRNEDLWFHTRNCAGSHVLLKIDAGQKVTDKILLECAKLAKEYSGAKNSSKVGIIYTKAKNLKKPPGANLGYVIYKEEKEIIID